jgi:superoxide reductase
MDRRTALKLGFWGSAGSLLVPPAAFAAQGPAALSSPLAGGVYYTLSNPGRWAKKAKGHAPRLKRAGDKVRVVTNHPMKGYRHYIVKHVILDRRFNYVSQTLFDPKKDSPESEYDISKLDDIVYAVSLCNLHDTWVGALRL